MNMDLTRYKILFLTDLDNTLIYSHRRNIGEDRVAVEPYEGRIVSFMTRFSFDMLKKIREEVLVVPISTRSLAQYRRICFSDDGWQPEFALCSNGGSLLVNGKVDETWEKESLELIAPAEDELKHMERILEKHKSRILDVRRVDGFFVFTKSEEPEMAVREMQDSADLRRVTIHQNGQKVYAMPRALHKGCGADRLVKLLEEMRGKPFDNIVRAGDSDFDIPFLQGEGIVYCPPEIGSLINNRQRQIIGKNIISDQILEEIWNLL